LFFHSCTENYKEPPPREINSLKKFPNELVGKYYSDAGNQSYGLFVDKKCFDEHMPFFEIRDSGVLIHDYRSQEYNLAPKDSAIDHINDSLVWLNESGVISPCKYLKCGDQIWTLGNDHVTFLTIGDSAELKNFKGYYFFSYRIENNLWRSFIFSARANKLTLYTHTFQMRGDDKLNGFTDVDTLATGNDEYYVINPDTTELMKMIKKKYFDRLLTFTKR